MGSVAEYKLTPKQIGHPVLLEIDFKNDQWVGKYGLQTDKKISALLKLYFQPISHSSLFFKLCQSIL